MTETMKAYRACVTWLHERAATMNDPHAKAILNSAAFDLGREKPLLTRAIPEGSVVVARGVLEEVQARHPGKFDPSRMYGTAYDAKMVEWCGFAHRAIARILATPEASTVEGGWKPDREAVARIIADGEEKPDPGSYPYPSALRAWSNAIIKADAILALKPSGRKST